MFTMVKLWHTETHEIKSLVGLGDATRHFGNLSRKVTKHYRGQRMLNATLIQIAKDLLRARSKVIVAGNDGGGNLLYIQADRIGELLQSVARFPAEHYAVIPIEGCALWYTYLTSLILYNDIILVLLTYYPVLCDL